MAAPITYVLVDGENVDATLGTSILMRRPASEARPRWERLLRFAETRWSQPARGVFFLAANADLPMAFVQALLAIGYRVIPLRGAPGEKVVDLAIQRTLEEIGRRSGDVILVSNDGDFIPQVIDLCSTRRVGIIGFTEFRNQGLTALSQRGVELFDLEYDVQAFNSRLPRVRIIPIEAFHPADFL